MTRTVKTMAAATTLATALLVSACSSNDGMGDHDMPAGAMTGMATTKSAGTAGGTADGSRRAHGQADITFASSMVPHHQQAIEMADLALARAAGADVRQLATRIKAAQDPEIKAMTGWLRAWGSAPMPTDHDMGGMGMGGMLTDQELAALEKASGSGFDRMWLQMMIRHHEGAVEMARTQLAQGQNPQAKDLAQAVIDGQSAEIATMKGLLDASE